MYLKTKKQQQKKKVENIEKKLNWKKVQMSFFRDAVLGQLPPRKIVPQPQN